MEKQCLPWQTQGLKMEQKRTPILLADDGSGRIARRNCDRSAAKQPPQQRTPPPAPKSSESLIWRTRSLDDGRSRGSDTSHHEDRAASDEIQRDDPGAEQQPLHSSFDASLLENDFNSIFRVSKRLLSTSGGISVTTDASKSWNNTSNPSTLHGALGNEWTPHSSGRKHMRPQPKTACRVNDEGDGEEDLICPGTVRKLARHNSNESSKSKGTPVRPHTRWRPSSRLGAAPTGSVWKPPLIKFPSTPTAPSSTATTHPPTTQERPLETTVETDSTESPSTTPFRFTSFPASLPRVHPPLRDLHHGFMPDSVRKRVFPPSTHTAPAIATAASSNTNNQSREEDGTQNTSISSLSTHGEEDNRMPQVHTRLFMDEDYAYSDDEEEDDACAGIVGRTRLNFNLMLSPKLPMQKEESPFKDLGEAAQNDVLKMAFEEDAEDATAPTDLSRPYEQRHVHSFPSTMSSHTPLRSLSGCDDLATTSTAGLTVSGVDAKPHGPHRNHLLADHHQHPGLKTPEEVQLHFQLADAAQCSPIPGIPEEEEHRTRTVKAGKSAPRLPPKPQSTTTLSAVVAEHTGPKTGSGGSVGDDVRHSFSQESASSTASAKLRRFRPMPDMSAFELDSGSKTGGGQDGSGDDMSGNMSAPSPKLLCPPTPVRTPAWAQDKDPKDLPSHLHRSNSLIMTRVLATCSPPQGVANIKANDGTNDQEMELEPPAGNKSQDGSTNSPQHPAAPPAIRRSVGEMRSIISFATDFEVLGILGKGAFADVYKVRCKVDNRLYAVKRNRRHFRSKRDRDISLAEVRSMQRLQQHASPNEQEANGFDYSQYLLFFYRAWQENGLLNLQTELCCRDTCRELIDCLRGPHWSLSRNKYPSLQRNLPVPDGVDPGSSVDMAGRLVPAMTVWKVCHDICAGLSHIHSRGLVHNDIKPSNIFFVAHRELGSLCKIGDFGMAGEIGTSEDGQEGDQKYMAPELLASGIKHASSDIFSLGLTLYEVAAGPGFELPKQGPRWHDLRNGKHSPSLPTSRDQQLSNLIQQMISASQDQRPCAEVILKHGSVRAAGHRCDGFLRDFMNDIEEHDRREEERRLAADQMAEDQTPRTGVNTAPCRSRVCSPTLGLFPTTAPSTMFTPEAQ